MRIVRFLLVAAVPFALLGCPDNSAKPEPASAAPKASGAAAATGAAAGSAAAPAASAGAGW